MLCGTGEIETREGKRENREMNRQNKNEDGNFGRGAHGGREEKGIEKKKRRLAIQCTAADCMLTGVLKFSERLKPVVRRAGRAPAELSGGRRG